MNQYATTEILKPLLTYEESAELLSILTEGIERYGTLSYLADQAGLIDARQLEQNLKRSKTLISLKSKLFMNILAYND